ncbi:MAG: TylF/MycF family methyltransferase [Prevotellaceae bacterium]|jgi:O-methyltransferase|nr:TylF/MycF family methyltransferase [Prevotellaceae bacterium]
MRKIVGHLLNQWLLGRKARIISQMVYIGRERHECIYGRVGDYVRLSSLELVAHNLQEKGIQGSVAELGVYRGNFAQHINTLFPNRKLYLFDTFEGFDERDAKTERGRRYSGANQNFADTSVDVVLSKMKHRENVIIKKGFFPDTATGVEDKFAFVSIDADLFDPIYQGLRFFYENLTRGGVIFVHDYNNAMYAGAKAAVEKFSEENNIPFFLLSDTCGSAIFLK